MQAAGFVRLVDSHLRRRPQIAMQGILGLGRAEPAYGHLGQARRIRTLTVWAEILLRLQAEVVIRSVVRGLLW
jgi:hypothetical protein